MTQKPTYEELEKRVYQLEQKLTEKQANIDSIILNTIPDLMFRLSKDGVHLDFHADSLDKLLVNPDDFLGCNVRDVLPADVSDKYIHYIRKAIEEKTIQDFIYQLKFAPRDIRYYEARLNSINEEEVLVIVREITDRIKSEENLQRQLALLKSTQSLSKIGGWEWDVKAQTMYWTDELYRIHGFTPGLIQPGSAEHIQKSIECYNENERPIIMNAFKECVENGKPYDYEFSFTTNDGNKIWIRTVGEPIIEDGMVSKVIGNVLDITDFKKIEWALHESEKRFSFHLQNTPVGAITWNLNFQVIEWNPAAEKIFGYSKEECVGRHAVELILPKDIKEHIDGIFQDLISERGGSRNINENVTKDCRRITCEWYNSNSR